MTTAFKQFQLFFWMFAETLESWDLLFEHTWVISLISGLKRRIILGCHHCRLYHSFNLTRISLHLKIKRKSKHRDFCYGWARPFNCFFKPARDGRTLLWSGSTGGLWSPCQLQRLWWGLSCSQLSPWRQMRSVFPAVSLPVCQVPHFITSHRNKRPKLSTQSNLLQWDLLGASWRSLI